jgi:hypothetical protein
LFLPAPVRSLPIHFAAIFTWVMSAVMAVMGAMVRWPMAGPHVWVFLKAFLLLGAIVSAAILSLARIERRGGSLAEVLAATVLTLSLPCLAWLFGRATDLVAIPILLALFAAGLRQVVLAARHARYQTMLAMLCGILAGVGYFLLINSLGMASVLSPEQALIGLTNLDTLFHASIANMLVKHGVLSTGLDGFVPIDYHFLSHIWFGCAGLWFRTDTITAYYVGGQVIGIPTLFFSLALATYLVLPAPRRLGNGALVLLLPLLLLVLTELYGWTSYLVSESYSFALIIFLLALPALAEMARGRSHRILDRRSLSLAAAVILTLLCKVSVGAVLGAAFGYVLLRQWTRTLFSFLKLSFVLALASLAGLIGLYGNLGGMSAFDPFSFVSDFPDAAWPNILANLILVCAAIIAWCYGARNERLSTEPFALIAIASSLPALLLLIPGGSGYYFINIGTFTAVVFVSAYGGAGLWRLAPRLFRPEFVLAAIVVVVLQTDRKTSSPFILGDRFAFMQHRTRGYLAEGTRPDPDPWQRIGLVLDPTSEIRRTFAQDVRRVKRAQAMQTLQDAGIAHAPKAAVFVPPENSVYWSAYRDCRAISFFVPAMFGVPMLRGFNPATLECEQQRYYGFPAYPADAISRDTTDAELCIRAAKWGLKTVFVLASPAEVRKVACGP